MKQPILNYIELPGHEIEATKKFYSDVFGWDWTVYGPTYASTMADGIEVGLSTEATPARIHNEGEQSSIGPLVLFQVDDVERLVPVISESGGQIITSPYDFPGGSRFHFTDPSGNVLGVYHYTTVED